MLNARILCQKVQNILQIIWNSNDCIYICIQYSKNLSIQCNLTAQIKSMQNKYKIIIFNQLSSQVFNSIFRKRMITVTTDQSIIFYYTPAPQRWRGVYCFTSVRPSKIFFVALFSVTWWQKSDIWSQASYRYPILWKAFLDPSDSYFLFADLVGFYTHWTYAHFSSHFSQQLLMAEIWYLVTSFI